MNEEWLNKIKDALDESNPTTRSLLFMLSNMAEELRAYRSTGLTPDEISTIKDSIFHD